MKEKSVNIVTFHNAHNYGAVLQCYALKKTIENEFGITCGVCNIVNDKINSVHPFKLIVKTTNIKGKIVSILSYPLKLKKYNAFSSFINKYLLSGNRLLPNDEEPIYICGSDQVWNCELSDFDKRYFLDFVKNHKNKNAYSASFGFDSVPENYKSEYKKLLLDFNKISVRETQGADILNELLGIDVPVTLDPSMLLEKKEWSQIAVSNKIKKDYILMYLMSISESAVNFARKLKKQTGLDIVFINGEVIKRKKGINYKSCIGPEEWISLFLNAKYIITNSFHGTAFSINFNKNFFVELLPPPAKVNSRLRNVISLFGLEDRMIVNGDNKNINKDINYERISEILKSERQKSLNYLKSIVEGNDE